MTSEPIIGHRSAHARAAVRNGDAVSAGQLVADASALAARMPPSQYVVNICRDRYAFAVGFCAALVAGRICLLPPARASEALAQLAQRYPDGIIVGDDAADSWASSAAPSMTQLAALAGASAKIVWPPPSIAREHIAAIAFTSGSTGTPQPQPKQWGRLVDGARAEVAALYLDDLPIEDVVLIGTVSAQHMYGLESSIMLALHGPCALAAEHPLHADEVHLVLSRISGRRVLVTTPVHLRALCESAQPLPALDRVISATAPLAQPLASRCESRWATRVFEIYGCTETGMVAARRTVEGPVWTTMRGVKVEQTGDGFEASGGHVQPGLLMDRLRLASETSFELGGRADDLINIGGKRASLEGLNRLLLAIDGVEDGAIFLPDTEATATRELRLIALIVAPTCSAAEVLAKLRTKVDAAFLPRPLLRVAALPRNAQGKLPRAELLALAKRVQCTKSRACRRPHDDAPEGADSIHLHGSR